MDFDPEDRPFNLAPALELKLEPSDAAKGVITGYASTFGGEPDSHRDIIEPGAFAKSLAEHKAAGTRPLMLWSHNLSMPIGRWTEMHEDSHGLHAKGVLNLETSRGRDAHGHLKAGDVSGLSIGYMASPSGQKRGASGIRHLSEVHLVEASVVATPSNPNARVMGVKTLASRRELEALLHEAGLAKNAAIKLAAGGWPALAAEDVEQATQLVARIKAATQAMRTT